MSASVAPAVQTISLGSQLTKFATWDLASSTASSAFQPNLCDLEAGLPKFPSMVKWSDIFFATLGSTGVVDA